MQTNSMVDKVIIIIIMIITTILPSSQSVPRKDYATLLNRKLLECWFQKLQVGEGGDSWWHLYVVC